MTRSALPSLFAVAAASMLLVAPEVASAHVREDASLRTVHAELTAVGEGSSTELAPSADWHATVRDEVAVTPAPAATGSHWYGWQTLTVDLISFAALPAYGVGFGGYFLGAPIIHAAHDQWGTAIASFGLRVALPVAGGFAGGALASCSNRNEDYCGLGEVFLGMAVGMITAVVIDSAALSYETAPATAGSTARAPQVAITPWIERDRKGASVAITF